MHMYKRVYEILGLIVLFVGIIISFFLEILIPDAHCSYGYLRLLFYINLAGTVSTYYLAYNRTFLIADQKTYITSVIDTVFYFAFSFLQIIILIIAPHYLAYLIINIVKNIVSNIFITISVKKHYNFSSVSIEKKYIKEYKPKILKYVKDVFLSRIGSFIYYSTDNIIISIFKGSLLTGFLSNYTMVTNQVNVLVTQVLSSIQATFGNFVVLHENVKERKQMVLNYLCANFIIGNFCLICLLCLLQPFINIFFGEEYILPFHTVMWLSINLLITILLQLPSQIFQIFKLYNYDKAIILISAALNIIISVALVNKLGIDGCLIGTFITSLIYLFSRFYIISKKVFLDSFRLYLIILLKYFAIALISSVVVYVTTFQLADDEIVFFLVKTFFVILEAALVTISLLSFSKELFFLVNKLVPHNFRIFFEKRILFLVTVLVIILSAFLDNIL